MNITVIHKQSKWSKFKRRVGSWFANDKDNDNVNLPEIIVTSHEENTGTGICYSDTVLNADELL